MHTLYNAHEAASAPYRETLRPSGYLGYLGYLESHAIYVIREVAAECKRPTILFSGGKDSAVILHLAAKAFQPARLPFSLLHVDTGHNFDEALSFRDKRADEVDAHLIIASVQDSIDAGRVADPGPGASRNRLQSTTLLDAISQYRIDACLGGARRDEDKARAKERVLSFRDRFGQWDPHNQRPELWNIYNLAIKEGEHLRAFPLSDWTEMDIWHYIKQENIPLPSLYYAAERPVVERDRMLLAVNKWVQPTGDETLRLEMVRFRTVGDATCTGAVRSTATTPGEVIEELKGARLSERGATRADDRFSETAMEDRKKEGYF
ncbi:MAG: sulfate adenylyltransferase subunit CysD [Acidimicrobiales bacterium]